MKNYPKTEEERLERNEYFRQYRKANKKKIEANNIRFWLKRAKELAAEGK